MKQIINISLFVVILMFFSCSDGNNDEKKTESKKETKSDSTQTEIKEEIYIPEILKGRVTKTLSAGETSEISSIYYEYFKLDEKSPSYLKTINEMVSKAVQSDFEEPKKNKITSNLSKKFFTNILTDFANSFSESGEEFMPWSIMDSIHINDSKETFAHLEVFTYTFAGGAHGNGSELHYLIDKKTGEILNLNSVFKNKKKLNALIDSYFRKSVGLSPNENLQDAGWFIEGRLTANENFYFTDKKVVFVFNPYEIGPYAAGAPIVEIPLSKLEDILNLNLN